MIRLFLLACGLLSIIIALVINDTPADDSIAAPAVTRAETAEGLRLLGPLAQTPGPGQGPVTLEMLARSIVIEYRRPVTGERLREVASQAGESEGGMADLTRGVLAGLGGSQTPEAPAKDSPEALNALIVQAMREGRSDADVDALLNDAVETGQVTPPAAIVTSSGAVDTATLLDSLVRRSMEAQPVNIELVNAPAFSDPAPQPLAAPGNRRIAALQPAAAPQPLPEVAPAEEGGLTYVVQAGDSLAGIALRHYGSTAAYDIIYRANRDKLPSPSAVRPGMTLRIPAL
ncbi:LysM peptidoglycan-binding domain-containing protein [Marinovum sp.]|uniref:LysM peptidoglycan-binding domain-containing protein n=1 Tax=Marinovum sp. TaxID=2024839 RepID=UPI003A8E100D